MDHYLPHLEGVTARKMHRGDKERARHEKTSLICVSLSPKVDSALMVWIADGQVSEADSVLKIVSRKLTT